MTYPTSFRPVNFLWRLSGDPGNVKKERQIDTGDSSLSTELRDLNVGRDSVGQPL